MSNWAYNLPLAEMTQDKATVIRMSLDCVQKHHNYMTGNVFPANDKFSDKVVGTSGVTMSIQKEGTRAHNMTKGFPK